jgi:lipoyl-dependent peroxiredoxin
MPLEKLLYTARATAVGGRDGHAESSDGSLHVKLARPRELGGSGGPGTNPEQLFAAGYSACFISSMQFVATRDKVAFPPELSIEASVGLGAIRNGFALDATLKISAPGVPRTEIESLVEKAHLVCPYSNATRGNVDVRLIIL